ncbi:MAG: right-handed parallel beta-helix repeat-containing protein [Armatimonadetes bacterium]|nr:right-handed parallel beta-helix repeat-containing protein [Armatimonadota bacterium]
MSTYSLLAALAAILALALLTPAQAGMKLYVSPQGREGNPGTARRPFATLEAARDAVRALRQAGKVPPGGVTIEIRGGLYELRQPLELEKGDSGTPRSPVVWQARQGETVRLTGGRYVTGWESVKDETVRKRLDASARSRVRQADLRAQGIGPYSPMKSAPGWGGSEPGLEVFFRDRPMTLARWPNEGYTTIQDVAIYDYDIRGMKGSTQGRFYYEGDRPGRWADEPDPMAHGWWFYDWADQRYRIASIDTASRLITLDGIGNFRKGQWFYAYNLLCELDRPGEWYLDRQKGILYFWPPEPLEEGQVMVSLLPGLVVMKDVSHVTIKGLTLEGCQGTAVSMSGGTGNRVARCVIRNTGGFAVKVDGGRGHGVIGCDLYQMGDGGIILHGGETRTLTHAEHYAENNHIHHYSRWNPMYKVGIQMTGVGCRASHNLIHHAPHVAIGFNGQEHLIEYNEIHNVVEHANDAGAIYTQPGLEEDWTMQGNIIRYNYLHHIYGFEGKGCVGVYLDDCFSSMHCYGNLFYRVPAAAFIGGGRDSLVENNLFIDCDPAIHVDARGMGWAAHIEPYLRRTLEELPYRQPPWSERYPRLLSLLQDEPMAPKGNLFARNICWGGRWDAIEDRARPYVRFEDNLIGQDPRFIDAKKLDFRLRADSPARKIGFKPIPFRKIGLYRDALRASWPVAHSASPLVEKEKTAMPSERILAVNNRHPQASDDNPGTETAPYLTINAAAQHAMPGDTVLVHEGVYREEIVPLRGGEEGKLITYMAAPDEAVYIKGSDLYRGTWEKAGKAGVYSGRLELKGYNPFAIPLVEKLESYAQAMEGAVTRRTLGQVFVDGRMLDEVESRTDLEAMPGTWRACDGGSRLEVHFPQAITDPSKHQVEITVRKAVFRPERRGLGHIAIRGFRLEHAANQTLSFFWSEGFAPQQGLVSCRSGHHWIIENNSIRFAKGIGLDIGSEGREKLDGQDSPDRIGYHLIRGNTISDNGQGGICGLWHVGTRIIGNIFERNNNQGAIAWEEAAIKTHFYFNGLIEGNLIRDNYTNGIWLDNTYQNVRITRNVVLRNNGAGIFLEMGGGPCLIDNNIIGLSAMGNNGIGGNGIYAHDAGGFTIAHNFIFQNANYGIHTQIVSERSYPRYANEITETRPKPLAVLPCHCNDQKIANNILADNHRGAIHLPYPGPKAQGNASDNNLITGSGFGAWCAVNTTGGASAETILKAWQGKDALLQTDEVFPLTLDQWRQLMGMDRRSTLTSLYNMHWQLSHPGPGAWLAFRIEGDPSQADCPPVPGVESDFYGQPLPESGAAPGPFQKMSRPGNYYFRLWPAN